MLVLTSAAAAARFAYARVTARLAPPSHNVFWPVPDFAFGDQHARSVTRAQLLGNVWIADFIFTRCTSVCPTLTARLRQIQRRLADPSLRFVSFSVDPAHDTTEALRRYAETWAKDETRWLLLRTQPQALQGLVDGMRVVAEPTSDANNPILHTSLFFLVDRAGDVRGMYDSNDDLALARLIDDARALSANSGSVLPAPASAQPGQAEFDQLGCAGCHDNDRLAPTLSGTWGRDIVLRDGRKARVDAAYIRESIVAPAAKRVSGYPDTMPAYQSSLSTKQLEALVDYVSGLARVPSAASLSVPSTPSGMVAQDPVCGMSVRVSERTPHARHEGKDVYFCSDLCKERFLSRHPR